MQKGKLIQLFKAIGKTELREFTQFVKSPFYNRNQRVIALYMYLKKHKKNLDDEKLTKEYIFKRIFPKGEEYEDWKMRELMSDLSKLIEEYFIVKEARCDNINKQMLLIRSFEKRQIDGYFVAYAHHLDKAINKLEVKNMEHYLIQLRLHHMLYYHPTTSPFNVKESRKLMSGILYNTDMFYSLAKLRYGYEIAAWYRLHGEKIEGFISGEVFEELPDDVVNNNLVLTIYQLSNQLYKYRDDEIYIKMKELILKNIHKFNEEEAYIIFISLINSVSLVISHEKAAKEVLSLYKLGLKYNVLMQRGRFSITHFNNIVSLGSSEGEYKWTQNFINEYYKYLHTGNERIENIRTLFTAYLNFLRQEYGEVERILYMLEFEDFSYGLRHYTLLIRSLYELQKNEIFDRCSAFRVYIHRKNRDHFIGKDIHESYSNFIRIVEDLFNLRGQFRPETQKLRNRIHTMKNIAMKSWLLEKLDEL